MLNTLRNSFQPQVGPRVDDKDIKIRNDGPMIKDDSYLVTKYWAVVEPALFQDMLPRTFLSPAKKLNGDKQSLDTFDDLNAAATYAQKLNRPLLILEITACATVTPQLPVVETVDVSKVKPTGATKAA